MNLIRLSKKDKKEFRKLQDKYHKKINRLENQGLDTPAKISINDVQNMSRRDYNNFKKFVNDFTSKNSEKETTYKNVSVPVWRKKDLMRKLKSITMKQHYDFKKYNKFNGTEFVKSKENLKDIDDFEDPEKLFKYLDKKYTDKDRFAGYEIYKNNYLSAVEDVYGSDSELYKFINDKDAFKIFDALKVSQDFSIPYVYISSKILNGYEMLIEDWQVYFS